MKKRYFSAFLATLLICSPATTLSKQGEIGGEFNLTTHLDQPYSLSDSRGKVVLLFFGFTQCPDVCPNTLGIIQTVLHQLGEQAKHVQPLMISVDPKRDSPSVLTNYLKYFGSNFIGLTGSIKEIDEVVEQYKAFYSYIGNTDTNAYTVDHTPNLYLINSEGVLTNSFPYGLPAELITKNIQALLSPSNL